MSERISVDGLIIDRCFEKEEIALRITIEHGEYGDDIYFYSKYDDSIANQITEQISKEGYLFNSDENDKISNTYHAESGSHPIRVEIYNGNDELNREVYEKLIVVL